MPPQQQMQMPSSFGRLMRYNEEYKSPFKLSPVQVVIFIIAIIALVSALKIFWPIVV
jgi:preprotein translocase subunit Sec61beta